MNIVEIEPPTPKGLYEIRHETWQNEWDDSTPPTEMHQAYTLTGDYIGPVETAEKVCDKEGIHPELIGPEGNVCRLGYSPRQEKWFGWSHRAIYGFGIGDVAKEDDVITESGWTEEYLAEHPDADTSVPVGTVAETLDDAKRMAIAFAEAVG